MNQNDIRMFLTIAKTGSLNQAARPPLRDAAGSQPTIKSPGGRTRDHALSPQTGTTEPHTHRERTRVLRDCCQDGCTFSGKFPCPVYGRRALPVDPHGRESECPSLPAPVQAPLFHDTAALLKNLHRQDPYHLPEHLRPQL